MPVDKFGRMSDAKTRDTRVSLNYINNDYLLHKNPCFQSNTAITNVLVSNSCEIRFHDVIGQITVPMYSYAKILKHG